MRRALHIVAALATAFAPTRAELRREGFPVPPVVDAAFRSGGLAAFDPFDPWQGENAKPAALLPAASTGEDAAKLPPGAYYDVLPAWTARGFQPHDGTHVFYHPQTQILFARIAPEDAAQVRAFCEWPPAFWLSETYWGAGGVKQILLRVTSWEVPATGAGGWDFQPSSVEEFLELPATARRMMQRQSFVIRGGQRAKGMTFTTPRQGHERTLEGATTKAEVNVSEDGTTLDLNLAPELKVRLADGTSVVLSSQFQQLCEWGQPWLMEAGTLPGQPPRRVFQVCETLRVNETIQSEESLTLNVERWTGHVMETGQGGSTFSIWSFLREEAPLPVIKEGELLPPARIELLPPIRIERTDSQPPADPFAAPADPVTNVKKPEILTNTFPPLFGDVPMQDATKEIESAIRVPPGQVRAWRLPGGRQVYLQGSPQGMAAISRWFSPIFSSGSVRTAIAEAKVSTLSPGGAPPRILWQGSVPIRSGQRSALQLKGDQPAASDAAHPFPCQLEMEATRADGPPGPDLRDGTVQVWSLEAAFSIRPPFVDAPLTMPAQKEVGTPSGVTMCRALGRTAAGEDVLLTIHLREVEVRSPHLSSDPLLDWWWRRQLVKSAK